MKKILVSVALLLSTAARAEFIELESSADLGKAKNKIVILKVYGSFCGACKYIAPYFHQLADEYPDITFAAIEADKGGSLSSGVTGLPTFFVYKNGKRVSGEKLVGADQEGLKALAEKYKGQGAAKEKASAKKTESSEESDSSWSSFFGLGEEKEAVKTDAKSKKQMKKQDKKTKKMVKNRTKKTGDAEVVAVAVEETEEVMAPKKATKKATKKHIVKSGVVKSECVGGNCGA